MTGLPFALLVMLGWAFAIVVLSRWKYGFALLAGLGTYVGAFALGRELGAQPVATAWATMAAIGAIVTTIREPMGSDGRNVSVVPSTIATFIVGLLAWPLVFPGIRTPKSDPAAVAASAPQSVTAASTAQAHDDTDDDREVAPVSDAIALRARTGLPTTSVAFATPLSILLGNADSHAAGVRGLALARATATTPAFARDESGVSASWDENVGKRIRISDYDHGGGRLDLLGDDDHVLQQIARTRLPTMSRDEWYALASAFGRLYEGAVVVEDSLAGLDA